MDRIVDRKVVLVTRHTRLEELIGRFHTAAQAKFYVEHLGADFSDYEKEHATYVAAKQAMVDYLEIRGHYQVIDRSFLSNFLFAEEDIVIALGQDGLVANIMKYLKGQPLIGVNPDPYRYDGILLPFDTKDIPSIMSDVSRDIRPFKSITMAKASLSDGQTLYAVNDLFIGPKSHTSARYEVRLGKQREVQSSSGIIVSTGLGSTAWLKSIVTGAYRIAGGYAHADVPLKYNPMPWDAAYLQFAVREPFPSKTSQTTLVYGRVEKQTGFSLLSLMPENGVIFSDGIESDFLAFNSGTEAAIGVAERNGCLVI